MSSDTARPRRPGVAAPAPAVLVMDDEASVRDILGRFLERSGYHPITTASVEAALDVLRRGRVEAVVLDVRMSDGGRSGLEVLAALRADPRLAAVPAIVLTGALLTDEEEIAVIRHRAHLVRKPEGYAALVGFLDHLTGRVELD
ncbi:MAG TPA: response regulator [Vicinamibacterales bacterium]|nr:response regulator [Vicinamibacterales bacterium]